MRKLYNQRILEGDNLVQIGGIKRERNKKGKGMAVAG